MMNIQRWEACSFNLEELVELDSLAFGDSSWSQLNFQKELPEKFRLSMVMMQENHIEGYAVLYLSADNVAHLSRIAIRNRNNGNGQKLMQAVFENSKPEVDRITLEHPAELNVNSFYEELGFVKLNESELSAYVIRMNKAAEFYTSGQRVVYQLSIA
jgi:N-acetylglutamate synthase-like GNAT family acetyltransferase